MEFEEEELLYDAFVSLLFVHLLSGALICAVTCYESYIIALHNLQLEVLQFLP